MNRRTLPVAVAAAAAATLLLTACGGGDSKANDKISGTESSAPPSTSPSASPSDVAGRPKITLPADVKNVYEGWTTGDPVKDAILADVTNRANATDAAIANDEPESAAIPFYYQRDALIGASTWIAKFKKDDLSLTGTTRFYNPKIEMLGDTAAGVGYCTDESQGFAKERKTGKVLTTPVTKDSYVFYNVRMDKNQQGVWQTTQMDSKRGDKTCTP